MPTCHVFTRAKIKSRFLGILVNLPSQFFEYNGINSSCYGPSGVTLEYATQLSTLYLQVKSAAGFDWDMVAPISFHP